MSSSASNSQFLGRSLLNERNFIIGTVPLGPYISYANVSLNGRINDIDGFVHQIILYLALKYQFTFEYVPSLDSALGAFFNGSWNGLVGMLYRGEIDLIATGLTTTYARTTVIGYTIPFDDDDRALLIPYPELEILGNIDGVARPFQYEIWISIGISVLTIAVVLWKISSFEFSMFIENEKVSTIHTKNLSFIYSLKSLFHFQYIPQPIRWPARLLLVAWCLVTIVLVNAYSSTLISYLMTPRYHPMIESVEDIANMTRPVFMVSKYSSHEAAILGADSGALLKVGNSLRKYPELRLNSESAYTQKTAELIVKHHKVLGAGKAALLAMMEQDLNDTGECILYLASKAWGENKPAFGLPKSSSIILIFSYEIIWLRQVGLLDYWHRRYWPRRNRCSLPLVVNIKHKTNQKLTINDLSSAFLLLGCGCVVSFVAFIFEMIIARALLAH